MNALGATLRDLVALISALEDYEPATDAAAYLKRELLTTLDGAREMLKCLAADEKEPK